MVESVPENESRRELSLWAWIWRKKKLKEHKSKLNGEERSVSSRPWFYSQCGRVEDDLKTQL